MDTPQIDFRLPPDAHPAVLSGTVPNLTHAMTQTYKIWSGVTGAAAQLDERAKGERPKPPGRKMSETESTFFQREVDAYMQKTSVYKADLAREAQPKIEGAISAFDKALDSARSQAANLEAEINSTLVPGAVNTAYHGEIRAAFGKKPSIAALSVAIDSGDKDIIATVLGSPLMLLGITEDTRAILKTKAVNQYCKEKAEKLNGLKTDITKASNARELFFDKMGASVREWRSPEQSIIKEALS